MVLFDFDQPEKDPELREIELFEKRQQQVIIHLRNSDACLASQVFKSPGPGDPDPPSWNPRLLRTLQQLCFIFRPLAGKQEVLEFVTATDEKGYWAVTLVARFIAPDIGFRQLRDGPWERSLADAWEAFMRSVEAKWTRMFHGTREAVEVEEDIVEVKEDEPEE